MKLNILAVIAPGLICLSALSYAAQTPLTPLQGPAGKLVARIESTEAALKKENSLSNRVTELGGLLQYLEGAIRDLPSENPDDETRQLRTTLWSFKLLLGPMVTQPFSPSECENYRAGIFSEVGPHDTKEDMPGEALEALKLLSLVCKRPELAEIPVKARSPAKRLE